MTPDPIHWANPAERAATHTDPPDRMLARRIRMLFFDEILSHCGWPSLGPMRGATSCCSRLYGLGSGGTGTAFLHRFLSHPIRDPQRLDSWVVLAVQVALFLRRTTDREVPPWRAPVFPACRLQARYVRSLFAKCSNEGGQSAFQYLLGTFSFLLLTHVNGLQLPRRSPQGKLYLPKTHTFTRCSIREQGCAAVQTPISTDSKLRPIRLRPP